MVVMVVVAGVVVKEMVGEEATVVPTDEKQAVGLVLMAATRAASREVSLASRSHEHRR